LARSIRTEPAKADNSEAFIGFGLSLLRGQNDYKIAGISEIID